MTTERSELQEQAEGNAQHSMERMVRGGGFHAAQKPHGMRDVMNPCAICGWSKHMAIHDDGQPRGKSPIPFHAWVSANNEVTHK